MPRAVIKPFSGKRSVNVVLLDTSGVFCQSASAYNLLFCNDLGHYVSDVYDCAKDEWTSYDDLTATKVDEHRVRYGRSREGYIFFYLYKQCVEAVKGQSPDTRKSNK